MPAHSLSAEHTDLLITRVLGTVIDPSHASYEEARRVHNGLIDKRPVLIARCQGTADVVHAIRFAREHDLPVSVRGGGHNVGGRAVIDGGLVIDLSTMKGVRVDQAGRTVRAQGGMRWREFNRETALFDLATTGGVVSTTGIAGLTLGGGLGWLMGRHGLAVDNLISAEVVDAEGRVREVDQASDPDLFWAIRGGGGNFGVATWFEYRLHPVSTVTGGIVAHPVSAARDMLRFYRDFTADLPDELVAFAALLHAPDGTKICAMVVGHCGTEAEAERVLAPLRGFGEPIMDTVTRMPYETLNTILDDGFPKGAFNHWKSSFLEALSDDAIDAMIDGFERCPSPMSSLLLEHFHGQATRVPVDATAFPHRTPGYNLAVLSQWADAGASEECIAWSRQTYEGMRPFLGGGRYVNYLDDDEADDAVAAAYGPNLPRLRELKRKYDPTNFFRMNQNVKP